MWLLFGLVSAIIIQTSFAILTEHPCKLRHRDAYGYDNIPNGVDDHDWTVASLPASTEDGNADTTDSCYLLHNLTSNHASEGDNALLYSSCYEPIDLTSRDISLRFKLFIQGRDVGSLGVYLRPGCNSSEAPTNDQLIWKVQGSQGDKWDEEPPLILNTVPTSAFQILFEAVVGNGPGFIALTEISTDGVICHENKTFFCDNSSCIPDYWVCDEEHIDDCIDGTDEIEAMCCDPLTKFKCNNERCIDKSQQCDGVNDCRQFVDETEDETNCEGTIVIPPTMESRNDGTMDSQTSGLVTEIHKTASDETKPFSFSGANLGGIIGGVVAASFLLLMAIIIWKKRICKKDPTPTEIQLLSKKRKSRTSPKDEGHLDTENNENETPEQPHYLNTNEIYLIESPDDKPSYENVVRQGFTTEMVPAKPSDDMYSSPPEEETVRREDDCYYDDTANLGLHPPIVSDEDLVYDLPPKYDNTATPGMDTPIASDVLYDVPPEFETTATPGIRTPVASDELYDYPPDVDA